MGSVAPWTVLERKITFSDPRLRVHTDLCLTPQGEVVGPAHVMEYPDRVAVVALSPSGLKIVLVRRYQHGATSVVTGLPSGAVDRAEGTPHLDVAEIAAQREHRNSARRAGMAALPNLRPRQHDSDAALTAAENAARRELLESAGYVAGQWNCLLKSYSDPSHQTNTTYCFLATALDRAPVPPAGRTGEAEEVIEYDFLTALRLLQQGGLMMDVLHAAALWSAASHIAADHSGRFGPLPMQFRRLFVGEDDSSRGGPLIPVAFPSATVGG